MIPIETLWLFAIASAALTIAPGPDNLFVMTQSALHGRRPGQIVTLGLCSGLLVHTTAVSLGVATIFQTSALAFNVLKYAGAIYLLYLAWQAFRAAGEVLESANSLDMTWQSLYARGVIMNITNPKVAIFFLAFLPQFADPAAGSSLVVQMLILGGLFILIALIIFSAIAWIAGEARSRLKVSTRAQVVMNRLAACVFVGLAFRLIMSEK